MIGYKENKDILYFNEVFEAKQKQVLIVIFVNQFFNKKKRLNFSFQNTFLVLRMNLYTCNIDCYEILSTKSTVTLIRYNANQHEPAFSCLLMSLHCMHLINI